MTRKFLADTFRRLGGGFPTNLCCLPFWLTLLALAIPLVSCAPAESPSGSETDSGAASGPQVTVPGFGGSISRDVVLITLDTLRADALGFEEGPWATPTPNIDRLAESGRRFSFAHAHNTVTLPSHANMLTGLYPFEHGVRENTGFVLDEEVPSAAEIFREAGFATGAFVSAYTLDSRYGLDRGFDVYDDRVESAPGALFQVGERRGDVAAAKALEWWREVGPEQRRFLWLHLFDPHAPYAPPEAFAKQYPERPYRGEVAAVDSFLAALLGELKSTSRSRPFIVITADHGEGLGDHGERTHGVFAYQPTLRVPLVIWGLGIDRAVDDRLARHVDLLPTMLEAAGLEVPDGITGRSLLGPPPQDVTSYFECLGPALERGWAPLRGMIKDGHKFIDLPIPELYDLAADPGETTNLVESERRLYREMQQMLPAGSTWPPERGQIDPEEAARLRSLGYLADSAAPRQRYGPEDDPKNLIELDDLIHRFSEAFAAGDFRAGETVARELIERRPSMPVGHTQLAHALLAQERRAEAVEVMQRANRTGVASPGLVRQLALSLAELGRASEALPVLEAMGPARAGDLDAESVYGQVLRELGRSSEAEAALRGVLEKDPEHAASWERLSALALDRGDAASAEENARRALEIDPSRRDSFNNLGVALLLQDQPDAAFEAWQQALEIDPRAFDTLYNLGMQATRFNRRDVAVPALERFVREASPARYSEDIAKARAVLGQISGR